MFLIVRPSVIYCIFQAAHLEDSDGFMGAEYLRVLARGCGCYILFQYYTLPYTNINESNTPKIMQESTWTAVQTHSEWKKCSDPTWLLTQIIPSTTRFHPHISSSECLPKLETSLSWSDWPVLRLNATTMHRQLLILLWRSFAQFRWHFCLFWPRYWVLETSCQHWQCTKPLSRDPQVFATRAAFFELFYFS